MPTPAPRARAARVGQSLRARGVDPDDDGTGTGSGSASDTTASTDSTGEPGTESSDSEGEPCGGVCEGDTPLCDENANGGEGECVQCLVDTDCDDAYECSEDVCEAGSCIALYADTKDCQPVWTQLSPDDAPPARFWPAMTYDAAHEEVVLFGGLVGGTMNGDTWIWNGSNWILETPATAPSPRWTAGAAYDPQPRARGPLRRYHDAVRHHGPGRDLGMGWRGLGNRS